MEEAAVIMVGLDEKRVLQGMQILESQTQPMRKVEDYQMPNVSEKITRIIHSYVDYVNRVVWKKY
jgi:UDP-N-acetylglucosamine 2-epimerase (non-hydrolysing)